MRKRVVISFIIEDSLSETPTLSKDLKQLLGTELSKLKCTHIVFCPGLDANVGQEIAVAFPPVLIDTTDYFDWNTDV